MDPFGEDAAQGIDLLGLALGRGVPGAAGADLDEFVDFEIYFDGTPPAVQAGTAVPYLRARLCDAFEVFGAAGLEKYLWHCDRLVLEVAFGDNPDDEPHLSGHMRTGDGAEDEWYVVYLLKQLTAARLDASCRVIDADGELLLIEAALAVPRWVTPANAEHRCWLRGGKVHLLPRPRHPEPQRLACHDALVRLRLGGDGTIAKEKVQEAIKRRLEGYPRKALDLSKQTARAVMPAIVARLLVVFPQLVAIAVDNLPPPATQELNRLRRGLTGNAAAVRFDCESLSEQDMVCIGVRFTRCQYARVMGLRSQLPQRFTQKNWRKSTGGDEKAMRVGAMLCAGLEAAFLQGTQRATAALRWPSSACEKVLLQECPWWRDSAFAHHVSMVAPKLSCHSHLVRLACEQQRVLDEPFRAALMDAMDNDVVKAVDLAMYWSDVDDPEDWLQISSDELDKEMQRRQEEFDAYDRKRSSNTHAGRDAAAVRAEAASNSTMPEQLRKELASMGKEISGLLEKASCLEGVDAATTAASSPETRSAQDRDEPSDTDSENSEVDVLGMEDEADDLSEEGESDGEDGIGCSVDRMHQYMEALDEELEEQEEFASHHGELGADTGASAETGLPLESHHIKVDPSEPLELDVHAMEHMLASYCAEHHCEPGPASLLLGELGLAGGGRAAKGYAGPLDSMD